MIWTRIAYAGIEIISIPAYAHVATCVQIILYALPVATLAQAYNVNRPLIVLLAFMSHQCLDNLYGKSYSVIQTQHYNWSSTEHIPQCVP